MKLLLQIELKKNNFDKYSTDAVLIEIDQLHNHVQFIRLVNMTPATS